MNTKRLYYALIGIAFLHSAATASIATVEVLYLRYGLLASYTMIGSVLGAAALGYLIFAPFLKTLPKILGRGTYLSWTSFILAAAAVLAPNIQEPAMYLVSKFIVILLAPITFGTLIEFIEDELRYNANTQACYAGLTAAAMGGGILGFVLGGQLGSVDYGLAYILTTALFIAAGFIGLLLPRSTQMVRATPSLNVLQRLQECFTDKHKHITWIVIAMNSYWSLRDIAIPLLLFDMGYGPATVGGLFAIGAFLGILSSAFTRVLLRKNHPEHVMVAALAISAVASLILPFGGLIVIGVLYAIYMSGEVALTPALSDRIEETASRESATPYISSLSTASALAWTITPWIVGVLLEAGLGIRILLFIGGAMIAAAYVAARSRYTPNKWFPKLSWKRNKKTLTW